MKIAFIGAGGIARNYRQSLKRLGRPVAAVCDVNAERAEQTAREESARAYTDHSRMLKDERPDVVFVCIPPGAQATQVADCAKAGAALFVAKPIATDLAVAERALDAIRSAGVVNQVGYMARYSDMTAKAREIVGARPLALGMGRFLCRMGASHPWWGKFAMSGGQMLEQSTHVFDYLRYFLGEVATVHALGLRNVSKEHIADFEECTVCNLQFTSGAVGNITSTCVAGAVEGFAAELIGDNLYLKMVMDRKLTGKVDGAAVEFEGTETGYFRQVEEFLQAVDRKDQILVRSDYESGLRTLAVTVAANRSLASGKPEPVRL